MNNTNTPISSLRRSTLRVSNISGSEVSATIQAYTVSISPTWAVGISKLWPISRSNATGTNSVVLKIKAASASAATLSQLPPWAVFTVVVMGENQNQANQARRKPGRTCPFLAQSTGIWQAPGAMDSGERGT